MKIAIFITLALLSLISSVRIRQIIPGEMAANATSPANITPPNETSSGNATSPNATSPVTATSPNATSPSNETSPVTATSPNATSPSNATSPVSSSNATESGVPSMISEPAFIPSGFFTEEYRVIPPQFWNLDNNTRAVILRDSVEKKALQCDKSGAVKLLQIQPGHFDHLFFPEMIGENIIRLRSYHGGYLFYDIIKKGLSCDSRRHDFMTRWMVFLNRDPRTQCMFLMWNNTVLGYDKDKLLIEPFGKDLKKYCWIGDPKNIQSWRSANAYKSSFDPTVLTASMPPVNSAEPPERPATSSTPSNSTQPMSP